MVTGNDDTDDTEGTDTEQPRDADNVEHVERSDVGASIEVSATRGTGTRDQEKFKLKGKGATAEEALAEFETLLEKYETEYSDRVRDIQPPEAEADDE